MATGRYARLPVGLLENLPPSVSGATSGAELLVRILLSSSRRTIPGLLRTGEAALADEMGWPLAITKRRLRELEDAGLVLFERATRDLLVRGAIEADGPKTEQSTKAMARQARELKSSAVRDEVARAIVTTLNDGKHDRLIAVWRIEFCPDSGPESTPDSKTETETESTFLPLSGIPRSEDPPTEQPQPQPHSDVAALADAWSRLPSPPFAAAAAEDFRCFKNAYGPERFWELLEALRVSKWVNAEKWGLTKGTPTLLKLLNKPDLLRRILNGEFVDPGVVPNCSQCRIAHPLIEPCPPECQDCQGRHAEAFTCSPRAARLYEETEQRQRQQLAAEEQSAAAAAGITVEELRKRQSEERRQALRAALPPGLRQSLEAKDRIRRAS